MTSSRTEDDNYWLSTRTKGFSFNDEQDTEDDAPWMKELSRTEKLKQELREEVSLYPSLSETSSLSEDLQQGNVTTQGLPDFLFASQNSPEKEYEPRENRILSFKVPEFEDWRNGIPNVRATIHGLLLGQDVNFEKYKSLAEKKSLLTKAIEINDGNSITSVVLFLQKSLRPSLFHQIIMENKTAACHYIRYLEKRSDTATLVDLLNMLGRTQDALIVRYKTILRSAGNLNKIETQLKHFYTADCNITDDFISNIVKIHFQLIETHKAILGKHSGFKFLEHQSVLNTLKYLCENFYEETSAPVSPALLRTKQSLSEKQYAWVSLNALTKNQNWPQIESLLISKSWLGVTKNKCLLPLEEVCLVLKDAPVDLISIFVRLIDNPEKKLSLAKKFKCHMVVLDIYAAKKDRNELLVYRTKLEENSKEALYAENLLNTTVTSKYK